MEIMYLLVPVSVILVFLIGMAFWWSLRSGQYDDMEGPAYRLLMDKDTPENVADVAGKTRPSGDPGSESLFVTGRDG